MNENNDSFSVPVVGIECLCCNFFSFYHPELLWHFQPTDNEVSFFFCLKWKEQTQTGTSLKWLLQGCWEPTRFTANKPAATTQPNGLEMWAKVYISLHVGFYFFPSSLHFDTSSAYSLTMFVCLNMQLFSTAETHFIHEIWLAEMII